MGNRPAFDVMVKQPGSGENGKKVYWVKVGSAWPSQQGGFTIDLHALPLTGKLYLFPPREKGQWQGNQGQRQQGFNQNQSQQGYPRRRAMTQPQQVTQEDFPGGENGEAQEQGQEELGDEWS